MNADGVMILGARGSMARGGREFAEYGGATTCVLVSLNGTQVVLDAGTGLLDLPDEVCALPRLALLLTHPHLDHLMGLPMCPYLSRKGAQLDMYAVPRVGETLMQTLERLFAPPIWPIGVDRLSAEVQVYPLPESMDLGGIHVETMEGSHPDGVTLFRLSGGGKSVVFATDCTFSEELMPKAAGFARGCDLLLADGQYFEQEWAHCAGFGHSTWRMALRLGELSEAGRVCVVHHDPRHTDAMLAAAERDAQVLFPHCTFAREGEEISL